MATSCADIPVPRDESLHLRPMQLLMEGASGFTADITVIRGDWRADAKSIFDVLMLAAEKGPIHIEASGPDAVKAVNALAHLLRNELK